MEIKISGSEEWVCLKKTEDNYFTCDGQGLDKLQFPISLRLTSIIGQQLETSLNEIQDTGNIATNIQYSGFSAGELTKVSQFR